MEPFHLQLDYYGALNLHKALLEAKFHLDPDNEMVSGSTILADIYVQVREFLTQSDQSGQWLQWFQLKNRPDYRERAILRMKKAGAGAAPPPPSRDRSPARFWPHSFMGKPSWTRSSQS